jgi:hypothetical protein
MSRKTIGVGMLLGALLTLVWLSVRLAGIRIYQVDECMNLYMARVLATGQAGAFFTNASLFLLGPLSWISQHATRSTELFASARLLFVAVFWLNLFLLASIASGRIFSARGCLAFAAAATLAPLWDYGFEIRHDNLILTGILLIWQAMRIKAPGPKAYLLAGCVSVALLFVAVKSVVYVLPLAAGVLIFPPGAERQRRWRLILAWMGGALIGAGIIRLCYGAGGAWDIYLAVFRGVTRYSANSEAGGERFWPWDTLARLLVQTPLLLTLAAAGCYATAQDVAQRKMAALTWEGILPESLLFLGSIAALFLNPTPYPYNLVNVVPFAFLLAFKYGLVLWNELQKRPALWAFAVAIVISAHLLPFGIATERHLERPNSRQRQLMCLAEDLTDPDRDPVYDGIGMVPTRPSIDHQWYIHSLNMGLFKAPGRRVQDLLATNPAVVFIPSYRTDWLPQADHDFIDKRYVPLADDFWVLGTVLPAGGGTFEIVHSGRYRISSLANSDIAAPSGETPDGSKREENSGTFGGTIDGAPLPAGPVELTAGSHHIETSGKARPAIVWIGPNLDRIGEIGAGNHRFLFVNWY